MGKKINAERALFNNSSLHKPPTSNSRRDSILFGLLTSPRNDNKNKSRNSVLPLVVSTVAENVGASNAGRDYTGSQSSWEALHHVTHRLEGCCSA